MTKSFDKLKSPYLDGELEFVVPTNELSSDLAHAIGEMPFANFAHLLGAETGQPSHAGVEPAPELETLAVRAAQPQKTGDVSAESPEYYAAEEVADTESSLDELEGEEELEAAEVWEELEAFRGRYSWTSPCTFG